MNVAQRSDLVRLGFDTVRQVRDLAAREHLTLEDATDVLCINHKLTAETSDKLRVLVGLEVS